MKTIAVANHKGGVAKTTTAFNLASGLREKNYKVLLIDLDPQGNLTFNCGISNDDLLGSSLYDVFVRHVSVNSCLFQVFDDLNDLDILCGGIGLRFADEEKKIDEDCINKVLLNLSKKYDYCVIDTPPSLNILTRAAITAADELLIPVQASPYSYTGVAYLLGVVRKINPNLKDISVLLVQLKPRTLLAKGFIEQYGSIEGIKLFENTIRDSTLVPESQLNQTNIFKYAPKSNVASDFRAFIDEYVGE